MRKVIILSGISGSGKSTYAEGILNATQGIKVSADHFFMKEGSYHFDATKLGEAHAECFRRFIDYLQQTPAWECVVVDNTNCQTWEIAPYMLAAAAFGYQAELHTLKCGNWNEVDMCARRNAHGVPDRTVYAQQRHMDARELPPYWSNTVVPLKIPFQ